MTFGNITGFPAVWPGVDKFLPKRGYMEWVTEPNQQLPPQRQQLIKDLIKALAG